VTGSVNSRALDEVGNSSHFDLFRIANLLAKHRSPVSVGP
jgi:hypothetical protein